MAGVAKARKAAIHGKARSLAPGRLLAPRWCRSGRSRNKAWADQGSASAGDEHHRAHQCHQQVFGEAHHPQRHLGVPPNAGAVEGEFVDEHRFAH